MLIKHFLIFPVITLCCLSFFHSAAQEKVPVKQAPPVKAALFATLPDTIRLGSFTIENLFLLPISRSLKIPAGFSKFIEGTLVEKVEKSPGVTSINIRSSNFDGALITLSRIKQKEKPVEYIGRIVSIKYRDVYLLAKENTGYYFTKQKQSTLLVE